MSQEQMKLALERLKMLAASLGHAIADEKQYEVPVVYDNHHNGGAEHTHQRPWAISQARAIIEATHGPNGRWCDVDGPITIIRHTPEFSEDLLQRILDLPNPL